MSKLGVFALSIVLLTWISLLPTLQIGVQGQLKQQQSSEAPESPGGSPSSGSTSPPLTTRPALDTAEGGAANQTGVGVGNQSAMVMIPQSTMQMIMSQLQDAMTAVDNNEVEAMTALNSVAQELKSAANASGVSVENTTGWAARGDAAAE